MPEIFVYMFEGRTVQQKRDLVKDLTDGVVSCLGVTPQSVTVQLIENSKSMRSRAGVLFSDLPPSEPTASRKSNS